ncbi:ABC transporter ATP-binding protein [Pseudonocardia sp. RS010]|uniref:ABC transporter ATP-binding protein n=1 Tax=Pseudonocardia sp. RS010 TaxID=3385979 RepID=UPI0039A1CE4F
MPEDVLTLIGVSAGYRKGVHAIVDVDLALPVGAALGVVGMNGAGKSTLMNTIAGRVRPERGLVRYDGADLAGVAPDRRARRGLVLLPEGHQVIASLTVEQNLLLAAGRRTLRSARRRVGEVADTVYGLFPILADRSGQLAGLLSGGEQQMLSIGRALVTGPRLLLLDEPSLGLAPAVVDRIYAALDELRRDGLTLVVVEQNDTRIRTLCTDIVVLHGGRVALSSPVGQATRDDVHSAYFGTRAAREATGVSLHDNEGSRA